MVRIKRTEKKTGLFILRVVRKDEADAYLTTAAGLPELVADPYFADQGTAEEHTGRLTAVRSLWPAAAFYLDQWAVAQAKSPVKAG